MLVNNWADARKVTNEIMVLNAGYNGRKVHLIGSCNAQTDVFISDARDDAEPVLMAVLMPGQVDLSFYIKRDANVMFSVAPEAGDVFLQTTARDTTVPGNQESFTRLAQRRARSPELEMMMFEMRENERRRDAHMEAELKRIEADAKATSGPARVSGAAEKPAAAEGVSADKPETAGSDSETDAGSPPSGD